MPVLIRSFAPQDRNEWDALWQEYLVFYKHELSDEQTELTWQRLVSNEGPIFGFLAELHGEVVGFTHHSFTHSTWEKYPAIYVEDLYVKPSVRGNGIARALAQNLFEVAQASGVERVHWITQHHNATARALYDQVGELTDFVVYERHL